MESIHPSPFSQMDYFKVFYSADEREPQELDSSLKKMGANLEVFIGLFLD